MWRPDARTALALGGTAVVVALGAGVAAASVPAQLPTPAAFPTERFLAHWWVFPAAVLFSTVALSAGVSGGLFFSPFFMLVVGLSPAQAIGAGLLTQVFGMGNGLRSYVRQRVVDYDVAKWLLLGAVPAVVAGALLANAVDPTVLKLAFGAGLFLLGGYLVRHDPPDRAEGASGPGHAPGDGSDRGSTVGDGGEFDRDVRGGETVIEAADGGTYRYELPGHLPGVALATVGGFLTGLISAGLPEVTTSQLVVRCRMPPRVAVATSVFVLGVATVAGAAVHALSATPVWYVVAWSVPGVLVGSTIGTRVGKHLPDELLQTGIGLVFAGVGAFVLVLELTVL